MAHHSPSSELVIQPLNDDMLAQIQVDPQKSVAQSQKLKRKERLIMEILKGLPDRYAGVVSHIIEHDLGQLNLAASEMYSSSIRKLLVPLLADRGVLLGYAWHTAHIISDLRISNANKYMKYRGILEGHGLIVRSGTLILSQNLILLERARYYMSSSPFINAAIERNMLRHMDQLLRKTWLLSVKYYRSCLLVLMAYYESVEDGSLEHDLAEFIAKTFFDIPLEKHQYMVTQFLRIHSKYGALLLERKESTR